MLWTKEKEQELRKLRSENKLLYTEIAKKLGAPVKSVRWKSKKLGLPSTQINLRCKLGKWNSKHNHLTEPVMTYFITHTWEETRKKFGLTQSNLKSLFSAGYRLPQFKHLRKETRDHSPWSVKQIKFLLQHAGLMPRKWIAEKIGRGNHICIKERMSSLGISSRTLQGITLSQFRKAFGKNPKFYIHTQAGPNGGCKNCLPTRWKIIPWVYLDDQIKEGNLFVPKEVKYFIHARALFQDWIFGGNAINKMKRIVKIN